VRELLPVYWIFVFISIITVILFKTNSLVHLYILVSLITTLLAGFVLFFAIKKIMGKRRLMPLNVLGAKSSDIYWILLFTAIQFGVVLILLYDRSSIESYSRVLLFLGHISLALIFWPIIESVLYLGMMFIPTSRIVGLVKGAILISLLQALSHFNHNSIEMVINFALFGLLGCYFYIKTKRIIVPLLLHSAINFFVVLHDMKFLS
jgi:membrane protease YdiL (CAAX protease family)